MWWKRLGSDLQALIILVILSAFLHLTYSWSIAPRWLNQDEAAILLNARYLVEAGKDEWGAVMPVVFRSFGDAKLPGYIWMVSLVGRVIGFVPMAVRVPSFVASLLLPIAVYSASKRIFRSSGIALAAAFFGVLSPWTYHYGTVGFESHVGLVLFLFSVALWFSAQPTWKTDLAAGVLGLCAGITYNAPFLLMPFVGVAVIAWRWRNVRSMVRAGSILFAAFLAILVLTWGATSQKQGIAFFQDGTVLSAYPEYRASYSGAMQSLLGNRWVYFAKIAADHFVSSFGWEFLVTQGGANPWHTIPGTGHLAFLVLPAAALGIGMSVRSSLQSRRRLQSLVPLILLVASLVPATITTDAPHATRSLFFFVMLLGFAGQGLFVSYEWICQCWKGWNGKFGLGVVSLLLILSFAVWWLPAHKNWKKQVDPHWYTGLEEALSRIEVRSAEKVYIVDPEGVLYTRVAVWSSMPYEHFAQTVRRSPPATTGLVRVEKLGKYEFVFQRSDAKGPGVVLEQQGNRSWGTIVL